MGKARGLTAQLGVAVDGVEQIAARFEHADLVGCDQRTCGRIVFLDSLDDLSIATWLGVQWYVATHELNVVQIQLFRPRREQADRRGLPRGDPYEDELAQRQSLPSTRVYAAASRTMIAPYRICFTGSGTSISVSTLLRTVRISAPTIVPE